MQFCSFICYTCITKIQVDMHVSVTLHAHASIEVYLHGVHRIESWCIRRTATNCYINTYLYGFGRMKEYLISCTSLSSHDSFCIPCPLVANVESEVCPFPLMDLLQ